MVFFLSPDEKVYARYGGRCADGPDERQSLEGLRYTMQSVLETDASRKELFAPGESGRPLFIRDIASSRRGRCIHCHQAKEIINNTLAGFDAWDPDDAFTYPPPENLGLRLDVDRGNIVKDVTDKSAAERAGLLPGDRLETLNGVPIHSFGDAQFALDRAPKTGSIPVTWRRGSQAHHDDIELKEGWRRSDITWRASMQSVLARPRLNGENLTTAEREALGLTATQLAFRQADRVFPQAAAAGIRAGDIILGFDGHASELTAYKFQTWVTHHHVLGETVQVDIIRDGKRMSLPMTFQ